MNEFVYSIEIHYPQIYTTHRYTGKYLIILPQTKFYGTEKNQDNIQNQIQRIQIEIKIIKKISARED